MTISNTFQENSSTVLFYSAFSIWKILHMCIFNSDQLLLENVVTANGVKMPLVLNKTHCWCTRIDKYSKWLRSNLMSWKGLNLSFWGIWGASLHFWRLLFCILMENLGGIHCCSDLPCRPTYVLKDRATTQGPVLANTAS